MTEKSVAESSSEPQKQEECVEFMALAVPNVMGGGMILYLLWNAAAVVGASETMNWVVGFILVVLYCYSNIGEPEAGTAFEAKKLERDIGPVPQASCAFLGLGKMGWFMAGNLAKQENISLKVWNRTGETTKQHHEKFNSQACGSIEEATKDMDFIFVCLPTTTVVEEIADKLSRHEGTKPKFFVDCTSGEPEASKKVAQKLKEKNIIYVDAPVSGGPSGAEKGTLTIMVGAECAEHFEKAQAVLKIMGARVVHVGPVGAGHAVKCVNNSMNASALLLSVEGLVALKQFGVEPDVALSVINKSSGRNLQTEDRIPNEVLTRKFDFGFALGLFAKDNRIAASLVKSDAKESYIRMTSKLIEEAEKKYGWDADFTNCVKLFEEQGGVELKASSSCL